MQDLLHFLLVNSVSASHYFVFGPREYPLFEIYFLLELALFCEEHSHIPLFHIFLFLAEDTPQLCVSVQPIKILVEPCLKPTYSL